MRLLRLLRLLLLLLLRRRRRRLLLLRGGDTVALSLTRHPFWLRDAAGR